MVELFPTRIRYTSMSLPYHIGNGWFGGFQQVADAPGDCDPIAQPATVAAPAGAEHGRDIFSLGGFFTEVQPHGHHIRSG